MLLPLISQFLNLLLPLKLFVLVLKEDNPMYEPVPNCKVKYPINNYVLFQKLSKSYVYYASQLSIVSSPNNM
jgi:hypothetical protein